MSSALPSVVLACSAFPVVYAGVKGVRRYALRRGVVDVPQTRSSHRVPTPRGGGLGLVVGVVAAAMAALLASSTPLPAVLAGAAAISAVAAVGWWDDHRSIGVRVRLVVHLLAALTVATLADRTLTGATAPLRPASGLWRAVLLGWWTLWTVSAINVVNFMDGIDGLIGGQLVVYGGYVAIMSELGEPAFALGLALAAGAAAFLCWNWSPARIFLGDVGSGPCGLLVVIAGLALFARGGIALPRVYLPLYSLFLDAAVTLWRRWRAGERVTTPHRTHLYQRLANGPWTHAATALAFVAVATAGAVVGALGARVTAAGSAALVVAYLIVVPAIGWRLERAVPWAVATPPRHHLD